MRQIYIDLNNREDILERYNQNDISNELIEYIIKQANFVKKEKIELIIKNKTNIKITDRLKQAFNDEYTNSLKSQHYNNIRQIVLVLVGIIFLILSMTIHEDILKEVLLIGSWVPIWEAFDSELFLDFRERRKRKILKKLMNSKIIESME